MKEACHQRENAARTAARPLQLDLAGVSSGRQHVSFALTSDNQDKGVDAMNAIAVALIISALSIGTAVAQSCATRAVSKDGKPLASAAKTSAIKRCCEEAAVSKDGRPLAGAAKASFVMKCECEA